jgi:hypothetical protein
MKAASKLSVILTAALSLTATCSLATDVRDGLVSYWPCDAVSGTYPLNTTPDVVGGNTLSGPLSLANPVPGKNGNAITFNGSSDYLYFINTAGADTGLPVANNGCWTCAFWVNGASGQPDQTTYFGQTSDSNNNWRYSMEGAYATANTRYFIRDGNNHVWVSQVGTTNTLNGNWHYLAYTYDANSGLFLVYVDGQPVYTNTFTYAQNDPAFDQVGVGALVRSSVGNFFTGSIDDVALWARALSQSEIQNVMNSSISTPVPNFAPTISVNPKGATDLLAGDNFTLAASCYGTRPLYYQWLRNGTNYPGANSRWLTFSNATTNINGSYQLLVTNSTGSATSTVAQVTVTAFGAPDLTNGMVAYYPCDSITAGKLPDLVSGYDMTLVNCGSSNLIAGKWGDAIQFYSSTPSYAIRSPALPTDALPVFRGTNCTISMWVNGNAANFVSAGSPVLAEANSTENNTQFTFGRNTSSHFSLYFRTDASVVLNGWSDTSATVWDGNWHNIVYEQHDAGGTLVASVYVDGVLDSVVPKPNYQMTVDGDALAWIPRPSGSVGANVAIDEVVYWNRPLSTNEIALLQTGYITNPPVRLTPLAIGSFTADLPAVASGDSTTLRWSVPADITSAYISNVGDVTALTVNNGGSASISVSVTNTTTYQLTVTRDTAALGHEVVSNSLTIGAVHGIATNWSLVDNFDWYQPGDLGTNNTWVDMYPATAFVVQLAGGNRQATVVPSSTLGGGANLMLNGLTITAGQARTLFFRITPQGSPVNALIQFLGISDRVASFPYQWDTEWNAGPLTYPLWDTNAWWLGVSPNFGFAFSTNPPALMPGNVYLVWIDITNVPIVNPVGSRTTAEEDQFSLYIQRQGDPSRTTLFNDVISDRALNTQDTYSTHYPDDNLNRLILGDYTIGSNDPADAVLYDDIYVSKSGYNATIPIGAGYAGPRPTLSIVNGKVYFQGTLQQASTLNGTWSNVATSSPYTLPTGGTQMFYRAVLQ